MLKERLLVVGCFKKFPAYRLNISKKTLLLHFHKTLGAELRFFLPARE